MTTLTEKLCTLFDCAADLTVALWHSAIDPAHVSPKQLGDHVAALTGVEIEFKGVDVETDHVFGHIERYDDGKRAVIYLVKNAPERYHVPVVAKELCQLLLDKREDWQPDGGDTLRRLVGQVLEWDAPENIGVRSEHLAERLSWEILYPFELRVTDKRDGVPSDVVATKRRLPLQIVELLLNPSDMDWCERWWRLINQARDQRRQNKNAAE